MKKCKVVEDFFDKHTGKLYIHGEIYEFSNERIAEIKKVEIHKLIEEIEEATSDSNSSDENSTSGQTVEEQTKKVVTSKTTKNRNEEE